MQEHEYRFKIYSPPATNRIDTYLFYYSGNKGYAITMEGGGLIEKEFDEGTEPPKFMSISQLSLGNIFQAMSNGLAEFGIFPEKENKEKIKAEALLEEVSNERKIFRDKIIEIVDRKTI